LKPIYLAVKSAVSIAYKLIMMILTPIYNLLKAIMEGLYYGIGGIFGIKKSRQRR